MINYDDTQPFLEEDLDYNHEPTLDAHMTCCGHEHMTDLFRLRQEALALHLILHAKGKGAGDPDHDACLEKLDQIDEWGTRGFKAIWS